jgi:hypothetical protein
MAPTLRSRARSALVGPVAGVWLLCAAATNLPHLRAALEPPPGRTFVGAFHYVEDIHNYVAFVQQAEEGRFVFANKLDLRERRPALVNLEWWIVGRLSRLLGRRPFLAYRIFGLLALAACVSATDRTLRRGGLPDSHRGVALLLVFFGGGLGGLLFTLTPRLVEQCVDLSVGLFPFFEALANPHWTVATWLLLEGLLAFHAARSAAGWARTALLGTALGLVRPYDLVLFGAIAGTSVLATRPPREWVRRLSPLAALLPVCGYCYWAFYAIDDFREHATTGYGMAPASDYLLALAPAFLVAALAFRRPSGTDEAPRLLVQLALWVAFAVALITFRPVSFSQQFTVGMGLPLLALGALGLGRLPRGWTLLAAVLMGSTAIVALRIVLVSDPHWHVPRTRREAALALRPACHAGDLAFSPADIGLYANALTSCRAYLSHPWAPGFAERLQTVGLFYGAMAPAGRAEILDRVRARAIVLPGDDGEAPVSWLGPDTPFRRLAAVGAGPGTITVYVRDGATP